MLAASADPARRTPQLAAVAEAYLWRLRKYLGAYLALVRSPQAVIFTDSIGEGVACVRQAVCANMEAFGVGIDPERNASADALPVDVATDRSPVRVLVIATNEELAIAREVHRALSAPESAAGKPPDGDARKRGGVANERRQRRNTSLTHAPRRIR